MQASDDDAITARNWTEMVARIRRGDPAGVEEFRAAYLQGIRFLMMRQLGARASDPVVDETLRLAIEGVRQGWLEHTRDLVTLLRRRVEENRVPSEERPTPRTAMWARIS